MMVDSSFLVDLARGDAGARALADAVDEGSESLRVPAPALAKFWEAVERSRRAPREIAGLQELLLGASSAAFESSHAIAAARLLASSAAQGWGLDPFDAMVAAIAVAEDETLVTRNARDFERVPQLRIRTY